MLGKLLLLFIVVPVIELALLIRIGMVIGFWPTVALIVITGMAGAMLAKSQGLSTWNRLSTRLQAGELPGREMIDGLIILISGAFLVTPGVLTDIVALMGLFPPTRGMIRQYLINRFEQRAKQGSAGFVWFGDRTGGGPPAGWRTSRGAEDAEWHEIDRPPDEPGGA